MAVIGRELPLLVLLLGLTSTPISQAGSETPADAPEPFRQGVRYTIEASLSEPEELLRAAAVLDYHNASPDTLGTIHLHLHLNAFRPNSLWARTETRAEYDFGELPLPEQAFERLLSARVGEVALVPEYPHAPDSTVVRLPLPSPLLPGGSVRLTLRWEARPSTLCRRQCRAGRHYDFAHWYPRIAVYESDGWQDHPLYPQGEFYGEFGTYDVTLDLPEDQVIGGTGVPLEGDPGWPRGSAGAHRSAFYGAVPERSPVGWLPNQVDRGRKRVRFFAKDVHHFAWSVDPRFRYEGTLLRGRSESPDDSLSAVAVHVLFREDAEDAWARHVVDRAVAALQWLERVFGPYPYPQLTVLQRLESGGTEFPMLVMNGSASEGLIFHEVAHQYVHAILANNEWREAWLDEGFAVFLGSWRREERAGPEVWEAPLARAARLEQLGLAEPVSTEAKDFSSFEMYGAMSYSKAALIFRMLRSVLGEESFRRFLREYYLRYRFRHVNEDGLRQVAEEVGGRSLGWFFDAWLHGTGRLDYAVGGTRVERRVDGKWRTVVEILRRGEIWMPIDVAVGEVVVRTESPDSVQVVEVITDRRPSVVELDPAGLLLDVDRSNNRARVGE